MQRAAKTIKCLLEQSAPLHTLRIQTTCRKNLWDRMRTKKKRRKIERSRNDEINCDLRNIKVAFNKSSDRLRFDQIS